MRNWVLGFLFLGTFSAIPLEARPQGRVDPGFTHFQIRQKEGGSTTQKLWMMGGRLDATVVPFEGYGLAIKSSTMIASGDGDFLTAGGAIGHYTPINSWLTVLPLIGGNYSRLSARMNTTLPIPNVGSVFFTDLSQVVESRSVYIGTDAYVTINKCFTITGTVQYAWARSMTTLSKGSTPFALPSDIVLKGGSSGFNLALAFDYYIKEWLSLQAAIGYNSSLDKEKFGFTALGYKLGITARF